MRTHFSNLSSAPIPADGRVLSGAKDVQILLDDLPLESSLAFALESENGNYLTCGIGSEIVCVQFTSADEPTCFLMALGDGTLTGNFKFDLGGNETEIAERYYLSITTFQRIAEFFVETGKPLDSIEWEQT